MKQNKKLDDWKSWVLSLIIILLIILFQRAYFPTTKQYCNNFSDKCVLTPIKFSFFKNIGKGIPNSFTEEECNQLQNENNKNYINRYCKSRLKTQAELDIDFCNKNPTAGTSCSCDLWNVYFKTEYNKTNNQYLYSTEALLSITNKEVLNDIYGKVCFKSRPKTECEKGNIDWVEECYLMEIQPNPNNQSHDLKCVQTICRDKTK